MKVRVKKQEANNISFASKLWALIDGIGSLSYTDKVKLFDGAVKLSREHVGDCVDAMLLAFYIALHDDHGFGAKRFKQLDETVQPIIDETVNRYDIATVYKLRSELKERGFEYTLHCEREVKE